MKKVLLATAVAALFAAPAVARDGQTQACYDEVWVPTTYTATKHLQVPAKTQYEHVSAHKVEQVYYPPVYIEKLHVKEAGHYVWRKVPCN